jgi:hypothetical protein
MTENGANLILKQNVLFSDIIIIDGTSYVAPSINALLGKTNRYRF